MNLYEVSINPFGVCPSGHFKIFARTPADAVARLCQDPRAQKLIAVAGFEIRLFNADAWVLSEDPETNGLIPSRAKKGGRK
jgi:hypothetical protein